MERHDPFTAILTHALACGQTRSVNLSITQGMSGLRREGDPTNHHTYTHEEPVDSKAGYQLHCAWFQEQYMKALYNWAAQLDAIKEGDRTLLDRSVLFAYTDHGAARLHSVHNYPFITIGSGNGRLKTGLHIPKPGDAAIARDLHADAGDGGADEQLRQRLQSRHDADLRSAGLRNSPGYIRCGL